MDNQTEEEIIEKVSKHEFYFETPLYDVIEIGKLDDDLFKGDVDAYNSASGFDTTYEIETSHIGYHDNDYQGFYTVTLTCKRKGADKLRFFIYKNKEVVVKLGQYPSLVDIQFSEIGKKYDRFLSQEALKEFKRAIGLVTHGVGVGSFVYLRRIFENLIYEAFYEHEKETGITKEEFSKKRMEDKVDILKKYLPSQLVAMKSIYSILSKGIHELNEQICLRYFPALKLSIELVLEQKIDMEIKEKRDRDVKKQIESISKEISK
ncbi:hypothetical protein KKE19_01390 [Patescibacteria group bacterium]|nr:hypothetical protein [Patescibacteria group bacterium]MBU4368037.1 hypothetical protein [Patescibacteria group bacterium]MBU4462208.1 hypothetical protein [Patescibacteria group bacterium]MCG2699564.1 hypothetical protein [Candidatus Parcubacteria bacterium]